MEKPKIIVKGLVDFKKATKIGLGLTFLVNAIQKKRSNAVFTVPLGLAMLRLLVRKTIGILSELLWNPKQFAEGSESSTLGVAISQVYTFRTWACVFHRGGIVTWSISENGEFGPPVVHAYGPAPQGLTYPMDGIVVSATTEDGILFKGIPSGWMLPTQVGSYPPTYAPGPYYPHTDMHTTAQIADTYIRPAFFDGSSVTWYGTADVYLPLWGDVFELEDSILLYEKYYYPGNQYPATGWNLAIWTFRGRTGWERLLIERPDYASDFLVHCDFAGMIGIRWSQQDTHSSYAVWCQYDYYDEAGNAVMIGTPVSIGPYTDAQIEIGRWYLVLTTQTDSAPGGGPLIIIVRSYYYVFLPGQTIIEQMLEYDASALNMSDITAGVQDYSYGVQSGPRFTRLIFTSWSNEYDFFFTASLQFGPSGESLDYNLTYAWYNGTVAELPRNPGLYPISVYSLDGEAVVYGSINNYYVASSAGLDQALPTGVTDVLLLLASPDKQYVTLTAWGVNEYFVALYRGNEKFASFPNADAATFSGDSTRLIAVSSSGALIVSLTELDEVYNQPTILYSVPASPPDLGRVVNDNMYRDRRFPPIITMEDATIGDGEDEQTYGSQKLIIFDIDRPPHAFLTSHSGSVANHGEYYAGTTEPAMPARYVANRVAFEYGEYVPPPPEE